MERNNGHEEGLHEITYRVGDKFRKFYCFDNCWANAVLQCEGFLRRKDLSGEVKYVGLIDEAPSEIVSNSKVN